MLEIAGILFAVYFLAGIVVSIVIFSGKETEFHFTDIFVFFLIALLYPILIVWALWAKK